MEVVILPGPADVAALVADAVEHVLSTRPRPVLGLATGSSPLPTYAELVHRHRTRGVSFAATTVFLLDEYIGLLPGHPESYRSFIGRHLTELVDIHPAAVHVPDGAADDLTQACRAYEVAISDAGGVDLQLLGIGTDGHLGFNEPTSSLASRTRVKTLTEQTREDNARFFGRLDEAPRHVVTQGIGTILEARHLVLVATGAAKAGAIARAVEGPLAAMCPASAIQLHPHVTVALDEEAAGELVLGDYYRATWRAKPGWQRI